MHFSELPLSQSLLKAAAELGFVNPMPIQEAVIPLMVDENSGDIIGLAQTGTGKTAAYGMPILETIDASSRKTQALILSPTRELCNQIANDLKSFSKYLEGVKITAIYGGASFENQLKELKQGPQIIAATPGRMLDMLSRGKISLEDLHWLILDEADEMLDMGFEEDVKAILDHAPQYRRTCLFSATMPNEVEKIALRYMMDPVTVSMGKRNEGASNVKHYYYVAHAKDRYSVLKRVIDSHPNIYAMVFCRTRAETQNIASSLIQDGYNAEALHGDLSQNQRDFVMQKFKEKHLQLLVCTDVAARGIDVDDLSHVINYNLPDELESYIHRSGRTGRAGRSGISVAIIHLKEKHKIKILEKQIGKEFAQAKIPTGQQVCEKQLFHLINTVENVEVNDAEIEGFLPIVYKKLDWLSTEDLIKRFVSVEFNRFLDYYRNSVDLNVDESREGNKNQPWARLFINFGKKDGLFPQTLLKLINESTKDRDIRIGHIDLSDNFSFFEVGASSVEKILKVFSGKHLNGRPVRIEVAEGRPQNKKSYKSRGERQENLEFSNPRTNKGRSERNSSSYSSRGKKEHASSRADHSAHQNRENRFNEEKPRSKNKGKPKKGR